MINSNLRSHRRLPRSDDAWALQLIIMNCDFYRQNVDGRALCVKGLRWQVTFRSKGNLLGWLATKGGDLLSQYMPGSWFSLRASYQLSYH